MGDNPLEGEQLLLDALYGTAKKVPAPISSAPISMGTTAAQAASPTPKPAKRAKQPKPQHYKIVSISLYNEDIERLEDLVGELKRRGHYKANKSQVIRQALEQLDIDSLRRHR